MKKLILGMMLLMGSLSFSSNVGTSVKLNNIFDNFKNEQPQDQEFFQNKLSIEKRTKISNMFNN